MTIGPEKGYIPSLNLEVESGQIVDVPKHRILGVDGKELDIECPSVVGIAYKYGGVPEFRFKVQCLNANNPEAEVQCLKAWEDEI